MAAYWDASKKVLSVVTRTFNVVPHGGTAVVVEPSGAGYPPAGGGLTFQAEHATGTGWTWATLHRDYTGSGYADFADSAGSGAYIEWKARTLYWRKGGLGCPCAFPIDPGRDPCRGRRMTTPLPACRHRPPS